MLIFDLGAYTLDSTSKYFEALPDNNIVAVEANMEIVEDFLKVKYAHYIESGNLEIVNKAVYDKDGTMIDFYIEDRSLYDEEYGTWSSIYRNIAERATKSKCSYKIDTVTLSSLIRRYGTPDYLKIDIEGADILVLKDLKRIDELPKLISAETECLDNRNSTDGLDVIRALHEGGYTKFFLEDQNTPVVDNVFTYPFVWMSYDECVEKLTELRKSHTFITNYDFWYDVYATY